MPIVQASIGADAGSKASCTMFCGAARIPCSRLHFGSPALPVRWMTAAVALPAAAAAARSSAQQPEDRRGLSAPRPPRRRRRLWRLPGCGPWPCGFARGTAAATPTGAAGAMTTAAGGGATGFSTCTGQLAACGYKRGCAQDTGGCVLVPFSISGLAQNHPCSRRRAGVQSDAWRKPLRSAPRSMNAACSDGSTLTTRPL